MKSAIAVLFAALTAAAPVAQDRRDGGMFYVGANGALGYTGPSLPIANPPIHTTTKSLPPVTSTTSRSSTTIKTTIRVTQTVTAAKITFISQPAATTTQAPVNTSPATSSNSLGSPVQDDYPYNLKQACNSIDQWSLNACQCVSFVAWRISQRLDKDFTRNFDSETWSNANTWDDAAREAGFIVDNNPTIGSIAQTDAGTWGHVAWVYGIDGDNVLVEEYNAMNPLAYDTRSASKSDFVYIHIPKE